MILRLLLTLATLALATTASAAPPASCARNFQGSWQITVLATGQTYVGEYRPDGSGVAHCPQCAPGTWTCNGDTLTVYVNGLTVVGTLSSDRTRITGGCCLAIRIGAVPATSPRSSPAGCTMPPPGEVTRSSPTLVCVRARNTNQDSRCVYSFTYLHSKSGLLNGGNVAAGATEERCALQAGVELSFGKWTRTAGSAR
ncbi:MAG TPA: hypothetical protein VF744_12185 [Beijerinckiaceae bacterium]|jgi:hypothetical protein